MTAARAYGRALWDARLLLGYTLLLSLTLGIGAPFLMIALRSVGKGWFGRLWLPPQLTLDWYRWAVEVGNIGEVLRNTLIIGVIAVCISTTIGIFAGWAFGRRRLPGKEVVMALLLLPLMIPSITYALGVARIFYALRLVDTHLGVALAHVAVCAPYAIMVLSATFERLDERVLEAAQVCGAMWITPKQSLSKRLCTSRARRCVERRREFRITFLATVESICSPLIMRWIIHRFGS